jgi:hypothetical protein
LIINALANLKMEDIKTVNYQDYDGADVRVGYSFGHKTTIDLDGVDNTFS